GPFAVLYNTFEILDGSRVDPLDPNNRTRKLMLSSFYPVESSKCEQICTAPYVSQNIAPYVDQFGASIGIPSGKLDKVALQVCCKTTGDENKNASNIPLVFLLHGFGGTRLIHSALAEELASAGFAVVTMDHTFESLAVEFPDGSVVTGLNDPSWDPTIPGRLEPLQDIRVDDVRYVLSQLKSMEVAAKVLPGALTGFNTERVAVFGHSFGGSTSIKLLMTDSRFVGALNLDGQQFGTITDMQQPAVLFGTTGVTPNPHNSTIDVTWAETLRHLKGWRAEIGLNNITHFGFTDVSYLNGTGALTLSKEVVDSLVGKLNGRRSFEIVSTYVTAFLDSVLRGGNTTLFDGTSQKFPEVVV
ncbi:PAF acetylhydrolase family protein, partial [Paraphaeosphaeria sporulosa]